MKLTNVIALIALGAIQALIVAPGRAQTANTAEKAAFDPQALQLLQQMCDAYARLKALDQSTEFYTIDTLIKPDAPAGTSAASTGTAAASGSPLASDGDKSSKATRVVKLKRSLRLVFLEPNLLHMEMSEPGEADKENLSEWDSDGKMFWTYFQDKNWYTKEKAPRQRSGFVKTKHLNSGSLELMMLLGLNPFADIRKQTDGVSLGGTETVHDVTTDVVVITTNEPSRVVQASFYIGHEDQLLHRLSVETRPVQIAPQPEPGKVGDELDALVTHHTAPPREPDSGPKRISRVTYDNIFASTEGVKPILFEFKPPSGALLYEPYDQKMGLNLSDKLHMINPYRATRLHVIRP